MDNISDKVVKGVHQFSEDTLWTFTGLTKFTVQAYLSDIWKPFSGPCDELMAGDYKLCRTNELSEGMGLLYYGDAGYWCDDEDNDFHNVTHYLNPSDILPAAIKGDTIHPLQKLTDNIEDLDNDFSEAIDRDIDYLTGNSQELKGET